MGSTSQPTTRTGKMSSQQESEVIDIAQECDNDDEVASVNEVEEVEPVNDECPFECCDLVRQAFNEHATHLREMRRERRRSLQIGTVVPPPSVASSVDGDSATGAGTGGGGAAPSDGTAPAVGVAPGVALETDQYEGDCVLRTLQQLLALIDDRGYTRSSQQISFHDAFIRACSRVMYKRDWSKDKPQIMSRNRWEKCPSQILVSTPRRFGKVRAFPRPAARSARILSSGCRLCADVFHCHLLCGARALLRPRDRRIQVSRCCSTEPSSRSVNFFSLLCSQSGPSSIA